MGHDVYCAFCGAKAGSIYFYEVTKKNTYDMTIANKEAAEWMGDVRLIGENPECPSQSKYLFPLRSHRRLDTVSDSDVESTYLEPPNTTTTDTSTCNPAMILPFSPKAGRSCGRK